MSKNLEDWLYKLSCKKGKPPWNCSVSVATSSRALTETTFSWKRDADFAVILPVAELGLDTERSSSPDTESQIIES